MNNNRFLKCFHYNFSGLTRATLIYLSIFAAIDLVIPILVYLFLGENIRSGDTTFNYGISSRMPGSLPFLLSTMIFLFVGAYASFRENFNHLLAMNNTRLNQFWATLVNMLAASGILVVIGIVIGWLETLIQAWINQDNPLDSLAAVFTWHGQNPLETLASLLIYLTVLLAAFSFGETAGIMSYRFGNLFTIPFWICFGASFIVVPILAGTTTWFTTLILWFFAYGQDNQVLLIGLHLLALTGIFKALSLIAMRKMPQAA